jgi:hypothetical protein
LYILQCRIACPLLHASRTHTSLDGIACASISWI